MRSVLFLMGPPGCGKTTVGKIVGRALRLPAFDVDNDILETFWGQPVSRVARVLSEPDFVRSEGMILLSSLRMLPRPSVLSLSGSNPLNESAFEKARRGNTTVFIDTPHEDIVARMGEMLTDRIAGLRRDGEDGLRELLRARHPVYEKSCDLRISVSPGQDPESIARAVIRSVRA